MTISNVQVEGGAGGTEAKYDDLAAMGDLTADVAGDTLKTAAAGHKFLVEPDVLASSLLNPGGVVEFEAAMAVALDGPNGLTATSAGIGLRGEALKATRIAYEMADELAAKGLDAARWFGGLAVATNSLGAALAGGGAIATDVYLNHDGDWEKWLVDHPGMVDTLIGMSPGMLSALGIPVDLATTLDLLAATNVLGEFRQVVGSHVHELDTDVSVPALPEQKPAGRPQSEAEDFSEKSVYRKESW